MELLEAIFIIITILIFLMAAMLTLSSILLRRAAKKVIELFRIKNALDLEDAKTREELGLTGQSFMERMVKPKDYKPQALEFLINWSVIKEAPDNRLYLCEEKLAELNHKKSQEGNMFEMWKIILPPK